MRNIFWLVAALFFFIQPQGARAGDVFSLFSKVLVFQRPILGPTWSPPIRVFQSSPGTTQSSKMTVNPASLEVSLTLWSQGDPAVHGLDCGADLRCDGLKEMNLSGIQDAVLASNARGDQLGVFLKGDASRDWGEEDNNTKWVGGFYSQSHSDWGAESDLSRLFLAPTQAQLVMNGSGAGAAVWSDVYPGTGDWDRFTDWNVYVGVFDPRTKTWGNADQLNEGGGGSLYWDFNTSPLVAMNSNGDTTVVWLYQASGFSDNPENFLDLDGPGPTRYKKDAIKINQYREDPENPGQKKWTGERTLVQFDRYGKNIRLHQLALDPSSGRQFLAFSDESGLWGMAGDQGGNWSSPADLDGTGPGGAMEAVKVGMDYLGNVLVVGRKSEGEAAGLFYRYLQFDGEDGPGFHLGVGNAIEIGEGVLGELAFDMNPDGHAVLLWNTCSTSEEDGKNCSLFAKTFRAGSGEIRTARIFSTGYGRLLNPPTMGNLEVEASSADFEVIAKWNVTTPNEGTRIFLSRYSTR